MVFASLDLRKAPLVDASLFLHACRNLTVSKDGKLDVDMFHYIVLQLKCLFAIVHLLIRVASGPSLAPDGTRFWPVWYL